MPRTPRANGGTWEASAWTHSSGYRIDKSYNEDLPFIVRDRPGGTVMDRFGTLAEAMAWVELDDRRAASGSSDDDKRKWLRGVYRITVRTQEFLSEEWKVSTFFVRARGVKAAKAKLTEYMDRHKLSLWITAYDARSMVATPSTSAAFRENRGKRGDPRYRDIAHA